MIDDFVPIIHRLPGRTTRIYPIADVHLGAKECQLEQFRAFLRRVQSETDSYICIVGDLLSNGTKDSLTNVYEELMPPSSQVDLAVELLTPVKDKILGGVGGNHEFRSVKAVDLDPLYQVFTLLRIPELYRQNMAFLRVSLKADNASTHDTYALMLTHGKTANKRKQFSYAIEGVDAIITGHTHDPSIEKPARLVFTKSNRVKVKPLISCVASSWLGVGGYSLRGLMLPKATSDPQSLILEFTGSNETQGQIRVSW